MTVLPLSALPLPAVVDAAGDKRARRPRAGLVPLGDDVAAGAREEPWYLGAGGTVAHRPANSGRTRAGRTTPGGPVPPDRAACGVFITQLLAGPDVARCDACRQAALDTPAPQGS